MTKILKCQIRSFTHLLEAGAFQVLQMEDLPLRASNIRENFFTLEIRETKQPALSETDFATSAHAAANYFLVALNVATLGLFLPDDSNHLSPTYELTDNVRGVLGTGIVVHEVHDTDLSGRVIAEQELVNALVLFGFLANEANQELVSEYLKGLLHLRMAYPGVHFEKDAFANFYRVFEHVATVRVLGKQRLSNEMRQMTEALSFLGISATTCNEFRELYALRGSQAMHAQRPPQRILREDAMKMKVFTDVVVWAAYKREWEQLNGDAKKP